MEQNFTIRRESGSLARRNIVGGFIAAHGAMHAMLLNTPRPDGGAGNFVTRGGDIGLLGSLGMGAPAVETLGAALLLIAAASLLVSAARYLRQRAGWESWLMGSSALSIASLLLFWNDWMIMGPIIDLGLMALALRSRVPGVA
jgi:hypothetical protein